MGGWSPSSPHPPRFRRVETCREASRWTWFHAVTPCAYRWAARKRGKISHLHTSRIKPVSEWNRPAACYARSNNRDLTIKVSSFSTNCGLRLRVSRYLFAHIWDLRLAGAACGGHVCCHSSTYFYIAEKLSSKLRFLKLNSIINKRKSSRKSYFFSNVGLWCFRVQRRK